MSGKRHPEQSPTVDEAINRVLAAERVARDAVEQCRRQATLRLDEAQILAKRVAARNERRVRAVQRIADRSVSRALEALVGDRGARPGEPEPNAAQMVRLEAAIGVLLDEMVGMPE